jgi:hypothetical protein
MISSQRYDPTSLFSLGCGESKFPGGERNIKPCVSHSAGMKMLVSLVVII